MAGVSTATGAISSLLGKLATLLTNEYKLLAGVRKQIEFLQRELSSMQVLLERLADMEEKLDAMAKDWRGKVRDLSYDIEDCIDRFMDRLGSGEAKRGFMKRTAHRLRTLWARHDIATQIKDLKARVIEESQRRDRYKLDESCYTWTKIVDIDPRITALYEDVSGLVAIDGPVKDITSLLMDDKEMQLKVVAIVGSGGLGKTTLAMEVYRKIGGDFQYRASVSVSRTLDLENLLKDILSQIDKDAYGECQSAGWGFQQLIRKIKQILTGKRYFIVIDDVWKEQDWKMVKAAFSKNNNGSRIIATTRITGVANLCCSNSGGQPYQMAPLNDVDSRRLFCKRIFYSGDPCPADLEEVATRILKKCGGLPLAIITFASLLAGKAHDKDEWERLQDSIGIGSLLEKDGNLKVMKDILLLSYWNLPHHLKTCLLYLCIYPEDCNISCEELKWKWMAEGFLKRQCGHLDQAAQNCFNELVNSNLIQPIECDGSVQYCRVHDMVLDLIISLSNEENFATVLNGFICKSAPNKIRRLSMQSCGGKCNGTVRAITETKSHVRSLTMFQRGERKINIAGFHALRVLDLEGYEWLENKHVKNIGSSPQLRFLRIHSNKITEIPSEIGKLQHLETLVLDGSVSSLTLPSTMVHLHKLVRLFVSPNVRLPADMFRGMQALEVLQQVDIWRTSNPMRFAEEIRELGKCNLRDLNTNREICWHLFRDPYCTFPYLQVLRIETIVEEVPKGMASLKNLTNLYLEVAEFDKEGLHILMSMPSLAYLQLKVTSVVKGELMICTNGFNLLMEFRFAYLLLGSIEPTDGLQLTFSLGAVPALRQLHLQLRPMVVLSEFFANLGIEHFSGLTHLQVEIDCGRAARGQVEAMESYIERAIELHPGHKIHVSRIWEHCMFEDDMKWEEAVAKDRKEREELKIYIAKIQEEERTRQNDRLVTGN
ncbi:disease resistance protein Pik-2-like [Triticum aestivum]|uniref:disease resistance protein Pik-2-like n=1 Tax=Triticum aestivum TaxID=4565 RepID=UPI001D01EAE8|nr:disease resistance protein Pik-2-like [Triticum aestivum]